jgi:hypothetical protein
VRIVRSWLKHSASLAARLSMVPLVQCIAGPPRSLKVRPSSNVAPAYLSWPFYQNF